MSYTFDFAVGVVLGQRTDQKPIGIYYACKKFFVFDSFLGEAQVNYSTIENEFIAIVLTSVKFFHIFSVFKLLYSSTMLLLNISSQ